MNILEIILVGVGLAMDASAASICKGLKIKKLNFKYALVIGLYFGIFQGLMPLLGYFLSHSFENIVTSVDHWIAFILLGLIGLNMIKESFDKESSSFDDKLDIKTMLILAIATSIDAFAVGVTFSFLDVNIFLASFIILLTTLVLSMVGVYIGYKFGNKYEKKSLLAGGLILIIMGIKILIEHLFF